MEKLGGNHVNLKRARVVAALSFLLLMTLCLSALAEDPDYGNDCDSAEPIDANGTVVEGGARQYCR